MQALIALGADSIRLTGRRTYVNAAVLGIPKSEVDRRFDEIIDFSE
jgi:ABC-type polysaccharide/polyol phosphate transport system ATPase subunit